MAGRFSIDAVFRAVDQITRPVSKMQRSVGKFTRRAEAGFRRMDRMAGRVSSTLRKGLTRGLGAAAGAAGSTILATNRLAQSNDELAKKTREMEMPIDEYQELAFAANQAGVDSQLLDSSIDSMNKRLGEAKAGGGQLNSVLKDMNPQLLEQLKNTDSTSEAIKAYTQAMRETDDPTERAAISSALFSKQGMDMARMAELSSGEIENLMRQQRENGNVTMEQAKTAEAYNDAVSSLKGAISGLATDALTPFMKRLTEISKRVRQWTIDNRELIAGRINEWLGWIIDNFEGIVKWAGRIGATLAIWFAFHAAIKTLVAVMTVFNAVLAANPITLIALGVIAAVAAIAALVAWVLKATGAADSWGEAFSMVVSGIGSALSWLGGVFQSIVGGFITVWQGLGAAMMGTIKLVFSFIKNGLGMLISALTGDWEAFGEYWDALWKSIGNTVQAVTDFIGTLISEISAKIEAIKDVAGSVASFFG